MDKHEKERLELKNHINELLDILDNKIMPYLGPQSRELVREFKYEIITLTEYKRTMPFLTWLNSLPVGADTTATAAFIL